MTVMTPEKLQNIIEAALMVSGQTLSINALLNLFPENECPDPTEIKTAILTLKERYQDCGIEIKEVASGFRIQAKAEFSPWLAKLWEERTPRYSRAFLETLAIIAYKQPITRAEIEDIRGVTVNSNIVKTLLEREWIRVVGYRDVPGKPAILGTTKTFLDHFNIKSLKELPTLAELKDFEAQDAQLQIQLALENSDVGPSNSDVIPGEGEVIMLEEMSAESITLEEVEVIEITTEAANPEEHITGTDNEEGLATS